MIALNEWLSAASVTLNIRNLYIIRTCRLLINLRNKNGTPVFQFNLPHPPQYTYTIFISGCRKVPNGTPHLPKGIIGLAISFDLRNLYQAQVSISVWLCWSESLTWHHSRHGTTNGTSSCWWGWWLLARLGLPWSWRWCLPWTQNGMNTPHRNRRSFREHPLDTSSWYWLISRSITVRSDWQR